MSSDHWKREPEEHDFPAAQDYLSLLLYRWSADSLAEALQKIEVEYRKGKDLLRASSLALLPKTNHHVIKNLKKIDKGEKLSPVLLIRGDLRVPRPLTIADGYHRICASYYLDEDANVPCFLVDFHV